jgi:serine/threonine protein kinase
MRAVLVSSEGCVRLGDFGMASMRGVGHKYATLAGSPFYMAPEMINEEGYDSGVDIWAVGCTVLSLCIPSAERRARGVGRIVALQTEGERLALVHMLLEKGFSVDLMDFVKCCLNENVAKRPTATQLLMHPFVQKHTPCTADDVTSFVPVWN